MIIAQKCPVCQGTRMVPNGFYSQSQQSTTDATPETCLTCNGEGIVYIEQGEPQTNKGGLHTYPEQES